MRIRSLLHALVGVLGPRAPHRGATRHGARLASLKWSPTRGQLCMAEVLYYAKPGATPRHSYPKGVLPT